MCFLIVEDLLARSVSDHAFVTGIDAFGKQLIGIMDIAFNAHKRVLFEQLDLHALFAAVKIDHADAFNDLHSERNGNHVRVFVAIDSDMNSLAPSQDALDLLDVLNLSFSQSHRLLLDRYDGISECLMKKDS